MPNSKGRRVGQREGQENRRVRESRDTEREKEEADVERSEGGRRKV